MSSRTRNFPLGICHLSSWDNVPDVENKAPGPRQEGDSTERDGRLPQELHLALRVMR